MAKKKEKTQVINNIGNVNFEIDYDKLADAIIAAQERAAEKRNEQSRLEIAERFQIKDFSNEKNKAKRGIKSFCNHMAVAKNVLFAKEKDAADLATLEVLTGYITSGAFALLERLLYLVALAAGLMLIPPISNFTVWYHYVISVVVVVAAFLWARMFRLAKFQCRNSKNSNFIVAILGLFISFVALVVSIAT